MSASLKNPRAAWPFPVRTPPAAPEIKTPPTEASLCAELEAWCKAQGLPYLSADELAVLELTAEQREYVSNFMKLWDALFSDEEGGQS
jgi:hypothetical protein